MTGSGNILSMLNQKEAYMTKCGFWLGLGLALAVTPAGAMNMMRHNARIGCASLVTQVHPDVAGKGRGAEIRKCKQDPEGYSKAAGF